MASSVWGDVGFAGMDVDALVELPGVGEEGLWRRRNLTSMGEG